MELAKTWITGDGGPIILMEEALLPFWEGSNEPSNGRIVEAEFRWGLDVATDYDRACDINNWAGVVDVADGFALVLGTSGDTATWVPDLVSEGALVEWVCADSENELLEEARNFAEAAVFEEVLKFDIRSSPLVLFMAVEHGSQPIYGRLAFDIVPGKYSVKSGMRKTEKTSVICHLFGLQDEEI